MPAHKELEETSINTSPEHTFTFGQISLNDIILYLTGAVGKKHETNCVMEFISSTRSHGENEMSVKSLLLRLML